MKKIFTLIAALAATAFISSAETVEYQVNCPSNGKTSANQVLSKDGDPIKVTSNFASGTSRDLRKYQTEAFSDGTLVSDFGISYSTSMRCSTAPSADDVKGTPNNTSCTSFELVVAEKISVMKVYYNATGDTRNINIYDQTNDKIIVNDASERTETTALNSNYGYIATWNDVEPGTYTLYATGFTPGFCGMKYTYETSKTTPMLTFAETSLSVKLGNGYNIGDEVAGVALNCDIADLEVAYSSSDENVATVASDGTLTILGEGSTTIKASTEATEQYRAAQASYTFIVRPEIEEFNATFGKATIGSQAKDTDVVGPCFTINGTYFASGTSKVKVYGSDTGMKLRTNKTNQTIILTIHENNVITEFKAGLVTNSSSAYNTLTGVLVDDVEIPFDAVQLKNTSDADGNAVVTLENIAAKNSISLVFGGTDQVFLAGEVKYYIKEVSEAPVLPKLTDENGVELGDIELNNANKTIYLTHEDEGVDLYWHFAPSAQQNTPMRAEATVEHDGKTFNLHTSEGITLTEAGTLSYFADRNGVRSDVQTVNVTGTGSGTTGIEAIAVDANEGAVEYFNLQGIRVANPSNGIFIRRQGKNVSKVLVK